MATRGAGGKFVKKDSAADAAVERTGTGASAPTRASRARKPKPAAPEDLLKGASTVQEIETVISGAAERMSQSDLERLISAAVASAVKSTVETLRAPTPQEQAILDRRKREAQQLKRDQADSIREQQMIQENCAHKRGDGKYRIATLHNFPDGIIRGICLINQCMIEPGNPHYAHVVSKTQEEQLGAVA